MLLRELALCPGAENAVKRRILLCRELMLCQGTDNPVKGTIKGTAKGTGGAAPLIVYRSKPVGQLGKHHANCSFVGFG
jgi:hypothetical protein